MKFSHIFIKRPIFAAVLSVLVLIVGALAYVSLPISQFPDVAPPTVEVVAMYPGANARTLSETVAAPLEKEINGVDVVRGDVILLKTGEPFDFFQKIGHFLEKNETLNFFY